MKSRILRKSESVVSATKTEIRIFLLLAITLLGLFAPLLGGLQDAHAANNYGGGYRPPPPVYNPPPVYRAPPPVYRQPPPVYRQPAPVYRQPAPVYRQQSPTYQPQRPNSGGKSGGFTNRAAPSRSVTQNQRPRIQNTPKIVIKSPQGTINSLKSSTSLSSKAQLTKPTAADLAYKQKMQNRLALIKKNKEERRLANLRKAEKERLDKEKNSIKTIEIVTPQGVVKQSDHPDALAARDKVVNGATLYRIGTTNISNAAEAQYWSLKHPLVNKGYSQLTGIPNKNVKDTNFIERSTLKPGTAFITRPAPGSGSNSGGDIEVVVPANGVQMRSFSHDEELKDNMQ